MDGEPDIEQIKERSRTAWGLGDYSPIERITGQAAQPLVDACAVSAGQEVLDVAAGTGNVAIAAAGEGARVVALDHAPEMIERGQHRTRSAGVDVEWVEGDAEALPFGDESFECVVSAFGAILTPRPSVMASEAFRVLRPGGTLGLTSWRPDSLIPATTALVGRYLPPPAGIPSASEWGEPDVARARLEPFAASIQIEMRTAEWTGESAEDWLAYQQKAGPHVAARQALPEDRYEELAREMLALARARARGDGPVTIPLDYLLIVARKRG